MKMTFDLRVTADRLRVGRALGVLVEAWEETEAGLVPTGERWDALEALRDSLEREALRQQQAGPGALLVRAVARLLGLAPPREVALASDLARLEGVRAGLRMAFGAIEQQARAAYQADLKEPERKRAPAGAVRAPGSSPAW